MINVKRLLDLDCKFKRYDGWSGADGIFSFVYKDNILMYFSDTFIGKSNELDKRISFELINNSLAISSVDLDKIKFIYNENPVSSVFVTKNGYYWLQDGIIENDYLYIFALRMENDIFSSIPFKINAVDLIKLSLPFDDSINYCISKTNLLMENIVLGTAIIKEKDYYYIYGYINDFTDKKLILSRCKSLKSLQLEYLKQDGSFNSSLDNLMILKDNFAAEFKIVKIKNKYYIAYTKGSIGKDIYLLVIDDLFTPYDKELHIYTCKEYGGNIITYNAKIQLAMSSQDKLVISYNVNTLVNEEHENLDIYRPRFIQIEMEDVYNEIK